MQQVIAQSLIAVVGVLAGACTQPQPADLAIRGAAIVDVRSGSLLTDQTVLVKDNRIMAVGSASTVQPTRAAQILEAEGKYLIPGLWDMHVHSLANVVLEGSGESVEAHDWHFPLFLAWGVTGVRNMNDGTGDVTLPGISLHEELERLVEAGLTPLEVLRAATLNPAHVLGLGHSLGTVEAGKLADLVLLDGNPLADIRNTQRIRAVVADGRLFRRVDLDRLLAEVEISYAKEKGPL